MASYSSEVSTSVSQKENSYKMKSPERSVVITPAMAQLIMKELQKVHNDLIEKLDEFDNSLKKMKESQNSLKGSLMQEIRSWRLDDQGITGRSENNITIVEERTQSTVRSQTEKRSPKLDEETDRISQCMKEEISQLKGHDDIVINSEIVRVERNVELTMTQSINKQQELHASIAEGNKYLGERAGELNSQFHNSDRGRSEDSEQVVESSMDLVINKGAMNAEVNIETSPEINHSGRYNRLWGVRKQISKSNYLLFSKMPIFKCRSEMDENLGDDSGEVEKLCKMKIAPETAKMRRIKKSGTRDQNKWNDRYMKRSKVIDAKVGQPFFGKRGDRNTTDDIWGKVMKRNYGSKKEEQQKCRTHRHKKKWNIVEGNSVDKEPQVRLE